MGEFIDETIICGEAEAEPLPGVTALGPAGIEVDPLNKGLQQLLAGQLKRVLESGRLEKHGSHIRLAPADMTRLEEPATKAVNSG